MTDNLNYENKTSEELITLYKRTKDIKIKQAIVLKHMHIIKSIAFRMRGVYVSFTNTDDIINEGVIALMGCIDKYNPEMNAKFETYVSKRLRGLVIDIARKQDFIPRSVRKAAKDMDNAFNALSSTLHREPTDLEMSEYLNISVEKYNEDLKNTGVLTVLSLDTLLDEDYMGKKTEGNETLIELKNESNPEENIISLEKEEILKNALKNLRENEQLVLSLYYEKELTMKEISRVLEVSEPRVSQIHRNALSKLKNSIEKYIME